MSERKYILAHDMGTSSDKAVLVDFAGNIAATSSAPYPTFYPNPAWVEQDPQDYWEAVALTSRTIVRENGMTIEQPLTANSASIASSAAGLLSLTAAIVSSTSKTPVKSSTPTTAISASIMIMEM